jgi:hemerythrin-like domain-containing protein
MNDRDGRRAFLTIAGAGALIAACRKEERAAPEPPSPSAVASPVTPPAGEAGKEAKEEGNEEVGATEDLMREHGVIRRVLVVFRESAVRLRTKPASVAPDALQKSARLIRSFGEDYHERLLEEAHIFPAVKKAGGAAAKEIDALLAQHQRGREITDYVLGVTTRAIGVAIAEPLARNLDAFARMYEEHAAREDTIVFPAWKKTLTPKQLDEIGDRFEEIEKKTFGKDGFDDAVEQIAAIEQAMGLELAAFLPPPPPPAPKP